MPQIVSGPFHIQRKVECRFREVLIIGRKRQGKTARIKDLLRLTDTQGLVLFEFEPKRQRTKRWSKSKRRAARQAQTKK